MQKLERRREEEERGITKKGQNAKIYREKERNTHHIAKNAKTGRGEEERRRGGEEERRRGGELMEEVKNATIREGN